uniref:Uncharacterized protein n=1 Tax=Anguilla anguilla TaxID=7936 RepID=A0A0E9UTY5_ANGAN
MLKQGGINQEAVASKSIAVDWMRCAPSPTAAYAQPSLGMRTAAVQ